MHDIFDTKLELEMETNHIDNLLNVLMNEPPSNFLLIPEFIARITDVEEWFKYYMILNNIGYFLLSEGPNHRAIEMHLRSFTGDSIN